MTQVTDFPTELFAKALHSCSLPVYLHFIGWPGILTNTSFIIETKVSRKANSQKHWLRAQAFRKISSQNAQGIYRNHCYWVAVVPELPMSINWIEEHNFPLTMRVLLLGCFKFPPFFAFASSWRKVPSMSMACSCVLPRQSIIKIRVLSK